MPMQGNEPNDDACEGRIDAQAIVNTVRQPLLVLTGDLRVETANPAFFRAFQVARDDTLGALVYELGNGQWDIPELRRLLEEVLPRDDEIADYRVEHGFETLGFRVMLLSARRMVREGRTDRILVSIDDVTEAEKARHELKAHKDYLEKVVDASRESLVVLDFGLNVHAANETFYESFAVTPGETIGRAIFDLGNGQWDIPELRRLLETILPQNASFDDYEVTHEFERIGRKAMILNARRVDHLQLILLAIEDVTERRASRAALEESERRASFLLGLADRLRAAADEPEMRDIAAEALGREIGANQVAYADIDRSGAYAVIDRDWTDGTMRSNAGRHRLEDFGRPFITELKRGRAIVVEDVARDPRTASAAETFAGVDIGAFLNIPIVRDGRLDAVLAVHAREARAWSPSAVRLAGETAERLWDAVARARAQAALTLSEKRFRALVEAAAQDVWEADAAGRFRAGAPGEEGWLAALHPDDRAHADEVWRAAIAAEQTFDAEFRLRAPDGSFRWTNLRAAPLRDADGRVVKWVGMNVDVDDRRRGEDERELLLAELNHRVKNLLGVIRSLANQGVAGRSAEEYRRALLGRVDALARAHSLALAGEWRGVDLADLARRTLEPYRRGDRAEAVTIAGPPVALSPRATMTIGLVLHELATNAMKYGAFSTPGGRLSLGWRRETSEDGAPRVRLTWAESGGPPVTAPESASFGTRMIERVFAHELRGDAELAYRPEGVRLEAWFAPS
ncbi:PAS domain-containing protein [Salinarimonas sp.]|uniref:PAS domain-containing protein n=1 Tax=Salinarimonas sp. TaxID=2766526 RepID=UPI0032D8FFA5